MSGRVRILIASFAASALVAVALIVADLTTAPNGERVAIVGDSITKIGSAQIERDLGQSFRADIRATFGVRIDEQLATASALAAERPEQVIINLGTNDVLQGIPVEDSVAALERMTAMFTSARCIHLVTVNPRLDQDGKRPWKQAEALNRRILELAARLDRGVVIRWDQVQLDAVSGDRPLGLTDDGVHPSPEGHRILAQAERDALERCGRPWHIW